MATKIKTEEKEENVISALLFRFAPYWPLFALLLLLFGFGAWLYQRYSTPLYEASATILIKDQKKGVDDADMLESLNLYNSKKIVENEIMIISSRSLMAGVVNRLHLYAPIYEEGRVKDKSAYVSSPVSIEVKNPEQLTSTEAVYFSYNNQTKKVKLNQQEYPLNHFVSTPYGELRFTESKTVTQTPSGRLYFTLKQPERVAAGMVKRLSITPPNKISTVLNLTFTDDSPEKAKDVLNRLIDEYAKSTIQEKNALAANTLSFIEERLGYVVKDLDSIERNIQQYKSRQGIVDLSEQGKTFLANVSNNDRQASTISMQLAALDQVENYVASKNNGAGIAPATLGLDDRVISQLLQRLYDAEREQTRLKQTMGENSPAVIAATTEVEKLRPTILENVRNQRQSLQASKADLAATTGAYTSMLRSIPEKERELLEINRQQNIKNNVYSFLLQKREETALSYSSALADSRLVDSAIASSIPVSPKKSLAYLVAVLLAVIIGVIVVSAKELLTNKILFRADIEKFTEVPIAAEISSIRHKNAVVVNQPGKSYMAEQFRHLRAAIGLYGRVTTKKKILITSSIAGEGKSFVAANLAYSLATSGKKVVLIDADLRGPKTSVNFGLQHKTGLAEFLEGTTSLQNILNQQEGTSLQVIAAGGARHNPTELLLGSSRMDDLFTQLERQFDYILIDTSPIDPVTDAYVFSEYCDKTLYIIRHGYTPKTMVKLLDDNNKIKALRNLHIVFNGVKKRGFFKGSYGFGYGFGYEYVYKDRDEQKLKA